MTERCKRTKADSVRFLIDYIARFDQFGSPMTHLPKERHFIQFGSNGCNGYSLVILAKKRPKKFQGIIGIQAPTEQLQRGLYTYRSCIYNYLFAVY